MSYLQRYAKSHSNAKSICRLSHISEQIGRRVPPRVCLANTIWCWEWDADACRRKDSSFFVPGFEQPHRVSKGGKQQRCKRFSTRRWTPAFPWRMLTQSSQGQGSPEPGPQQALPLVSDKQVVCRVSQQRVPRIMNKRLKMQNSECIKCIQMYWSL